MELRQLRVMLTVVITLLVTGLLCLPFENQKSASYFILLFALTMCIILGSCIALVIFFKARKEQDDDLD